MKFIKRKPTLAKIIKHLVKLTQLIIDFIENVENRAKWSNCIELILGHLLLLNRDSFLVSVGRGLPFAIFKFLFGFSIITNLKIAVLRIRLALARSLHSGPNWDKVIVWVWVFWVEPTH